MHFFVTLAADYFWRALKVFVTLRVVLSRGVVSKMNGTATSLPVVYFTSGFVTYFTSPNYKCWFVDAR